MPGIEINHMGEEITPDVIDREIAKWEQMHTGCAIMRANYTNEEDLDKDWYTWTCMSYHMKVLSNNIALRFYGIKNEEVYYRFKQQFLAKDFNEKDPSDLPKTYSPDEDSSLQESLENVKYAEDIDYKARALTHDTGYFIVTANNQTLEDLNKQIYKFRSMPQDKRAKADTLSLQLYGMKNEDNYKKQLYKLSNGSNVADNAFGDIINYNPPGKKSATDDKVDDDYSNLHLKGEDRVSENTNISYCEVIRDSLNESTDIMECAINLEQTLGSIKPKSTVEETVAKVMVENFQKKINEENNWLGYKTPFFLPQEIEELGVYDESVEDPSPYDTNKLDMGFVPTNPIMPDDWFANYQARAIGLKPCLKFLKIKWNTRISALTNGLDALPPAEMDARKNELIKFGWNPEIPYSPENLAKASERTNKIINDNMGYNFIDISEAVDNFASNLDAIKLNGLMVIFLSSEDLMPVSYDIPKVCVSTDYTLDKIYPISSGILQSPFSLNELRKNYENYKDLHIKIFYLKLPESQYEKVCQAIEFYVSKSNDVRYKYSFIQGITSRLKCACPDIANEKLFCVYLMNMILAISNRDYRDPYNIAVAPSIANLRGDTEIKDNIYTIFDGYWSEYDAERIANAISTLSSKYTIQNEALEFIRPYVQIIPVQEVATLPVDLDKDGNLFIRKAKKMDFPAEYSACHKMLVQYSKAKGYEAMKYYVAKLWYMNILLEKRLHTTNAKYTNEQLKMYYDTRAHILSDFKKYMGEILAQEPNFDFRAYYKTTPFDRSVLKINNTVLAAIWNFFKAILMPFKK